MKALDHHIDTALKFHAAEIAKHFHCDVLAYVGPLYWNSIAIYRETIDALATEKTRKSLGAYIPERLLIVLETDGGSAEVVEKLVEITRHRYSEVFFLIPGHAMSAGTIWCMSGEKIWMDYASSLGPIDPQVKSLNGRYVPALGYLEKMQELQKKSAKGGLTNADLIMLNALDLAELHRYEQARDLSITLLNQWLVKYKFKNWTTHRTTKPGTVVTASEKRARAKKIATELSSTRWHSHGRFIGMKTLVSDLRLEIDDFSALPDLGEHARMYVGLLNDHMERQDLPVIVHSAI